MDKSKLRKIITGTVLSLGLIAQSTAFSQVVFDPSNFVKNTITAGQQVQQTAVQIAIKAQEVKQYMLMVQDLKRLDPSVIQRGVNRGIIPPGQYSTPAQVANAAKGVYGVYESIGNNMNDYDTSYNGINTVMKDLDRTSAKANVAPDKILQYDFQRAQQGQNQDNNYYVALKNLNGQIAQHQKRTDELAAAIPAQSGTVELLQTIGTQNTVVQDQLSHLIQVNSITAAKLVQNSKDQELKAELDARAKVDGARTESKAGGYFSSKPQQ